MGIFVSSHTGLTFMMQDWYDWHFTAKLHHRLIHLALLYHRLVHQILVTTLLHYRLVCVPLMVLLHHTLVCLLDICKTL